MSLENAFNLVISMQGHECTITNVDKSSTATIKMAKSNMDRKLEFLEDSDYKGHEFVVAKKDLDAALYPTPKRGDKIVSTIIGTQYVSLVLEQIVMGVVIGYRLRCS